MGDKVWTRINAFFGNNLRKPCVELVACPADGFGVPRLMRGGPVNQLPIVTRPLPQKLPLAVGHPEQVANHQRGQRLGKLGHQICAFLQAIEQGVDPGLDPRDERCGECGREAPPHRVAQAGMVRRVV